MKRIRDPRDFLSGLLFVAFGAGAVVLGRRYTFGTTAEMGPGFFPTVLGSLLALMGVVACGRSLRTGAPAAAMDRLRARPVVLVLGPVVGFAVALPKLGLVVASMLLVVLSRFAAPGFRWVEVLVFSCLLTLLCAAIFVWGLRMPMLLWPAFFGG
jgi:Tripartite tricarboxylate transporter TctB family